MKRPAKQASLLSELRRRNVFRVGVAYLAATWLILQVAALVLESFEAPAWILQALIFSSVIGFPISLLLAWFYELTPEGIRAASELDVAEPVRLLGRRIDFAIIALLVLALSFLLVDDFVFEDPAGSSDGAFTRDSIAVLPFVNLSPDPDNEYFSDGLAEEIMNLLARVSGLKVVGRTSSFAFKGRNEDLRTIGNTLGVSTLLDGAVRRQDDQVRISAQLIDVADGTNIWSETYNRTMTDIFAVQDDVAAAIIDELKILVGERPTRGSPTQNSTAYTLFLRARALLHAFQLREAETAVLDAIALDPGFAEAYELLANVYWAQAGSVRETSDAQELMGETAAQALAINPDLVLAKALQRSGNLANYSMLAEIEAFRQAALEEPSDPSILGTLVFNLRRAGYLGEALEVAERLVAIDPLSTMARGRWLSSLFGLGRSCEVFANLSALDSDEALALNVDYWFRAEANLAVGRDESAIVNLQSFFEQRGMSSADGIRELVTEARNTVTGEAYLDRRISELIAAAPQEDRLDLQRRLPSLYLLFGYLDRFYEVLFGLELSSSAWTDADDLVDKGMVYPVLGFTAHQRYPELAEQLGITDVWQALGAPDYCRVEAGNWVCETVELREPGECE